jgi:WD40 repeat protein
MANRPIWQFPGEVAALNPSGPDLVIASGEEIHRVDLSTGTKLVTFDGRVAKSPKLAIVPDGNWLVSGDSNGAIRVWSMESGECVTTDALESSVWTISRISRHGLFVCGTEAGQVIVRQVRGIKVGPLYVTRFRPWIIEKNDWSGHLIVCCAECSSNNPVYNDSGEQLIVSCQGCDAELCLTSFHH